jgi:3-methyl-2-oxobutanoate hydroxymethyltransferase
MSPTEEVKKLTIRDLVRMKHTGERIAAATAYDYVTTKLVEAAGVEMVVVSDRGIATTLLGYRLPAQVKWAEVLFYLQGVSRIAQRAVVVGVLPFGSFQVSNEEAVRNATRMMKLGADAVMLADVGCSVERACAIAQSGVVSLVQLGALSLQNGPAHRSPTRDWVAQDAAYLVDRARALEEAGVWGLVLDGIPERAARVINERTSVVTIGTGGMTGCDGDLLTTHGILGLPEAAGPQSPRAYADYGKRMVEAIDAWCSEVRSLSFPTDKQTFGIKDEEFGRFLNMVDGGK